MINIYTDVVVLYIFFFFLEKLYCVRVESQARPPVHTQTPVSVQSVVVRDVTAVRVYDIRTDHGQYHYARHEIPQTTAVLRQHIGHVEFVFHRGVCVGIRFQTRGFPFQGTVAYTRTPIISGVTGQFRPQILHKGPKLSSPLHPPPHRDEESAGSRLHDPCIRFESLIISRLRDLLHLHIFYLTAVE